MATNDIFVNTSQNVTSKAIVVSRNRPKRPANLPSLVIGSDKPINLYLIDDAGNLDPRSGAAGITIRMGAGPLGGVPDSGIFTLSDGVDTSGFISHSASADVVESALNALNGNTGPHGDQVAVTSETDGFYSVKFETVGAKDLMVGYGDQLTPESAVVIQPQIVGDATTKAEQVISVTRQPAVYTDEFTRITDGWTGVLSANNARALWLVESEGKNGSIITDFEIETQEGTDTPEVIARGEIEISLEIINLAAFEAGIFPPSVNGIPDSEGLNFFLYGGGSGGWIQGAGDDAQISLGIQDPSFGGGAVGNGATTSLGGGAVGNAATANDGGGSVGNFAAANVGGGAVGNGATANDGGGAIGDGATANEGGGAIGVGSSSSFGGGAVGNGATASEGGGAIGFGATAKSGLAGGSGAKATASGASQIGPGTNNTVNTIQFRSSGSVTASEFGLLSNADTVANGGISDDDSVTASSAAVIDYAQPISLADAWAFSNNTTASDPSAGNFKLDNATQTSATNVYISDISASGEVKDFTGLGVGDQFRVTSSGLDSILFRISGAVINNTGWHTIPVEVVSNAGTISNNARCVFRQSFGALRRTSIVRSKKVYTGTATTDAVYLHVCDSSTGFTLTVSDGSNDGQEIKVMNRGTGTVALSGKISTITALDSLSQGETTVLNWDVTTDTWE